MRKKNVYKIYKRKTTGYTINTYYPNFGGFSTSKNVFKTKTEATKLIKKQQKSKKKLWY